MKVSVDLTHTLNRFFFAVKPQFGKKFVLDLCEILDQFIYTKFRSIIHMLKRFMRLKPRSEDEIYMMGK